MINASAQNMPIVVSRDFVLNLTPIVVRNISDVAVAIHNLGNQLINVGNFTLQLKSLLVVRCFFVFFFFRCFIFLLFRFFFSDAQGNGVESSGVVDLFAITFKVFVFNGVHSIVGMVSLPFCCRREFSLALV